MVTPLAGVWVEIWNAVESCLHGCVTPLAGVWVEMMNDTLKEIVQTSLPLRECGLK